MGRYRSRSRSYNPAATAATPLARSVMSIPAIAFIRVNLLESVARIPPLRRPEDLRIPFERFGPVKDVYLPKNYYTGEPRGFGFVKFRYPDDASEAKLQMNHQIIGGREISIVFAEENRKTPQDMRTSARISGRYNDRGHSPPRSPRQRYRSYSPSPSPRLDSRGRDRPRRGDYYSPPRSRTPPGRDGGYKALKPSLSPETDVRHRSRSHSYSPS